MINVYFPVTALELLTEAIANVPIITPGILYGSKLKLFKNDHTPDVADGLIDYEEADYDGYAEKALTTWGQPSRVVDDGEVTHPSQQYDFVSAVPTVSTNTVYGFYLTNAAEDALLLAARFDDPVSMATDADSIVVLLRVAISGILGSIQL